MSVSETERQLEREIDAAVERAEQAGAALLDEQALRINEEGAVARLTAERDALKARAEQSYENASQWAVELGECKAENDRLRAAGEAVQRQRDDLRAEVQKLTDAFETAGRACKRRKERYEKAEAEVERLRAALGNVRHIADVQSGDRDPLDFDPSDIEAQEECAEQYPLLYICYLASEALNHEEGSGHVHGVRAAREVTGGDHEQE